MSRLKFQTEAEIKHRRKKVKVALEVYRVVGNGIILGYIRYYANWRKYCFFPNSVCLFDSDCLEEVVVKLKQINEARQAALSELKKLNGGRIGKPIKSQEDAADTGVDEDGGETDREIPIKT